MNRDETLGADPLTRLTKCDLHTDPIVQFQRWLEQATLAGVCKPTAMTLATSFPWRFAVHRPNCAAERYRQAQVHLFHEL